MGLVKHTIRNLINGVSQQAPAVRLDNQVEEQINMIPDLTLGLIRRNPCELMSIRVNNNEFDYNTEDAMFKYTLNGVDILIGIKSDGTVYRFDNNNNNNEVSIKQEDSVKDYLTYSNKEDIEFVETNKGVFILNKGVKTGIDYTGYVEITFGGFSTYTDDDFIGNKAFLVLQDTTHETVDNNLVDKLVVWNEDRTKAAVYTKIFGADDLSDSFANSVVRSMVMVKEPDYTYSDIHSSYYDSSAPSYIRAYISYRNDTVESTIPFKFTSGKYLLRVLKADNNDDSTVEVITNNVNRGSVVLDRSTYGVWNDTLGNVLHDIEYNLTVVIGGHTYRAGAWAGHTSQYQYYYVETTLNKNRASALGVLPAKVVEVTSDETHSNDYWAVAPSSASSTNSEEFIFNNNHNMIQPWWGSGKLHISYNFEDKNSNLIYATASNTQFDENDTLQTLGKIELMYDDNTRIFGGWCIEESDDQGTHSYFNMTKQFSNDSNAYKVIVNKESSGTKVTENASSRSDAEDVESMTDVNHIFKKGEWLMDFPTLEGKVSLYNYKLKDTPTTNFRLMFWVTEAIDSVVYTVESYIYNYDGSLTYSGINVTSTATASSTPSTIAADLASKLPADGTNIGDGHIVSHSVKDNCVIIELDFPNNILKATTDVGSTQIYGASEATLGNRPSLDDAKNLPSILPDSGKDFVVRINSGSNRESNYYLKYDTMNSQWVETSLDNLDVLDAKTMPVFISKNGSSSISIEHKDWWYPVAGDQYSNKLPSIIGDKITGMILFNSRLGLSGTNTIVFSSIGNYTNLYRTTTADTLISDRVDLALDSSRLGYRKISSIFGLNGKIFVNTGETQSVLSLPSDLDLSKATFNSASSYAFGNITPLPVRQSVVFPVYSNGFTNMYAFGISGKRSYTSVQLTKHCDRYIKGYPLQYLYTSDVVLMRTDNARNKLYVQHSFIKDEQLAQNAWHEWSFPYDIKFMYYNGSDIHLVFKDPDNDRTLFCVLKLTANSVIKDTETQIGYKPYIDFYTDDYSLASTLDGYININKHTSEQESSPTSDSVYGIPFDSIVTLSEIIPRTADQSGTHKMGFSTLMLRRMALNVGFSGLLTITVSKTERDDYVHKYVPSAIGAIVIGRDEVSANSILFPVNGRSTDIGVQISTNGSFTPFSLLSVEWQGQLINRGGRL